MLLWPSECLNVISRSTSYPKATQNLLTLSTWFTNGIVPVISMDSADFRVGALYEMYEFLMQGVNFNGYPSKL